MTDPKQSGVPDLEQVKARGGLSWKVAALVVGVMLFGLVALGVMNRPPPTPEVAVAPSARPVRQTPTIEPLPTPFHMDPGPPIVVGPAPTPMPQIPPPPEVSAQGIGRGNDAFALIARIDGRLYIEVLQEVTRGSFSGIFRLPFPHSTKEPYRFDFVQLWTRAENRQNYVEIAYWNIPLTALREGTNDSGQLLHVALSGSANARTAPRAVRRGFEIDIGAESRYRYGVITVAVEFGARPAGTSAGRDVGLLVHRDWPRRQDKDDLIRLYRDLIGLEG